jgi:hypothetical protein
MSEEATPPTLKTVCDDEVDDVPTTPSQRVAEPTTVDRGEAKNTRTYILFVSRRRSANKHKHALHTYR